MSETIEQRFERLAPAAHALVAEHQRSGVAHASEIDTADVSPCPGCGVPVRRFSTTRWDRGGRESYAPWYCVTCIGQPLSVERPVVREVVDVELPAQLSTLVLSIHWPHRHVTPERAAALRAVLEAHPGIDLVEVHSRPGEVVRLPVRVWARSPGLRLAVAAAGEVQCSSWVYDTSELFE